MRSEKKSVNDLIFDYISIVIFVIAIILSFYPLIWMILNAFKTNSQLFQQPFSLPTHYNFSVYAAAWVQANFTSAFKNSIVVTVLTVFLNVASSSLAAFALARIKFYGNTFFYRLFASSMIVSGQIVIIPLFFIIKSFGLYDNLLSVILAGSAMGFPISIILLGSFFKGIPLEIEESTQIDGCPRVIFFLRFVIPLSKPILATIVILQSLWTWNDYLYPLTFLKDESVRTIPLQLYNFSTQFSTEWQKLFAALTIAVMPLIILYLILQKYFIKGLTAGAVKI
jgi:raffinose/stachyose/melibiose transport system permease protein